jgi:hypothetical protein
MKYTHNKVLGIGGMKCSCCRELGSKKACKIALNRLERRKVRVELKQQ